MELIVSANNNQEVVVFPYVPPNIELGSPYNYEEFNSVKGDITLLGERKLRGFEFEGYWFVNKNIPYANKRSFKDGRLYIDFFERWKARKIPFRVILTDGQRELINMASVVEYSYFYDKAGDIKYKIKFTEYLFV